MEKLAIDQILSLASIIRSQTREYLGENIPERSSVSEKVQRPPKQNVAKSFEKLIVCLDCTQPGGVDSRHSSP